MLCAGFLHLFKLLSCVFYSLCLSAQAFILIFILSGLNYTIPNALIVNSKTTLPVFIPNFLLKC